MGQPAGLAIPDGGIAVIIVNWNGWRLSLACLASLRTTRGAAWHLYIVDNASTDGSRDHMTELGEDVTIVLSPVNGGWTGGNNAGIRRALADGYDHVFILNNDAEVTSDTLVTLLRAGVEDGGRAILGPIHIQEDGRPEFIGSTVNPGTGLADITDIADADLAALPPTYPTAFIKGAGIFATRAHFDQLGLFDDAFYLNYDDTDWAFRAREAGIELRMVRDAVIVHAGSATIGGGYSPLNVYFLARNQLLFAQRHCTLGQRPRQMLGFLQQGNRLTPARTVPTRALALIFGGSPLARAWRAGVRDYMLGRFGDCPPEIRRMTAR